MRKFRKTKDLADIIKNRRKEQKLTQTLLAGLCNVGMRFIVALEAVKENFFPYNKEQDYCTLLFVADCFYYFLLLADDEEFFSDFLLNLNKFSSSFLSCSASNKEIVTSIFCWSITFHCLRRNGELSKINVIGLTPGEFGISTVTEVCPLSL